MTESYSISRSFTPAYSSLAAIRTMAEPLLLGAGDRDVLYLVAVTEIVTNAIEAHQTDRIADHIKVVVDVGARTVTVKDSGSGFDYRAVLELAADPLAPRGRGLLIAASLCPEMQVTSTDSGTAVTLPYS